MEMWTIKMRRLGLGGGVAAAALVCLWAGWRLWGVGFRGVADVASARSVDAQPRFDPDYTGLVIPPNIAPLNFRIMEEGQDFLVRISCDAAEPLEIRCHGRDLHDSDQTVAQTAQDVPRRPAVLRRLCATRRRDVGSVQASRESGCRRAGRLIHRLSASSAQQDGDHDPGDFSEGPRVLSRVGPGYHPRRDLQLLQLPQLLSARSQPVSLSYPQEARGDDPGDGRGDPQNRHGSGPDVPSAGLHLVASGRPSHSGHL